MRPKNLRMHKGMVPTLLSALTQLTHASLRTPVNMPSIPLPGDEERASGTNISPRRLAEPHPQGNSAVIDIKP